MTTLRSKLTLLRGYVWLTWHPRGQALAVMLDAARRAMPYQHWWMYLPLPRRAGSKMVYAHLINAVCKDAGLRLPVGGIAALWLYAQPFRLIAALHWRLSDYFQRRQGCYPYPHEALTEFLLTGSTDIMAPDHNTPAESRKLARLVNLTLGGALAALVAALWRLFR